MSLKAVHLVFILVTVVLAGWISAWCFQRFNAGDGTVMLVGGVVAGVAGAGLIWYAVRFVQKFRNVKYY